MEVENIIALDGTWVQKDNISPDDLNTYEIGIGNNGTQNDNENHTCANCVAINHTVYKLTNLPTYSHPKCKCKYLPYNFTGVSLLFDKRKITDYLFVQKDKRAFVESMGYTIYDSEEIYQTISTVVTRMFIAGKYECRNLDNKGQRMRIVYSISGKGEKCDKKYNCYTGFINYPNATLKITTPLVRLT